MKGTKWILVTILLASLVFGLTACGGDEEVAPTSVEPTQAAQVETEEEQQAQPTATQAPPTATAAPEAEPTEKPESEPEVDETLDLATLPTTSELSSFRSSMRMVITALENDQQVEQALEFSIEYTSEPKAQHVTISGTAFGDQETAGTIETYLIEDTMYTKLDDQWMSFPATESDFGTEGLLDPDDMIDDTCGWKKQERTDIDGVPSQHWTLSYADLEACATATELTGLGELTDAGGDIYLALDGGYVTQMDIYYVGENLALELGETEEGQVIQRVDFHYTVTDANEPFTIELPEEAQASSALPEDIPVPDDAEQLNNMFGMILFASASTPSEVSEFYKTAMPDYGWTEASSSEMAGMYMLEFTKEDKTASLIINTDDEGKTSVMITIQEE